MSATKTDLLAQAEKIKKQIDGGKITGPKKIKSARYKMYNLKYRAKQLGMKSKAASEPKAKVAKQAKVAKIEEGTIVSKKAKGFDRDQGILPNFLAQMNMVRIEELVAEKIFSAIKTGAVVIKLDEVISAAVPAPAEKSAEVATEDFTPVFSKKAKAG